MTTRAPNSHFSPSTDCTLFKPAAFLPEIRRLINNTNVFPTATSLNHSPMGSMGVKVVSLRAHNPSRGLPLVPATVLHLHPETGVVDAVLAGTYLTAARTAAGSALAVQQYFAWPSTAKAVNAMNESQDAVLRHVVVFGAGLQAEQHVIAIHSIYNNSIESSTDTDNCKPIPCVTLINRNCDRAFTLAMRLIDANVVETCTVVALSNAKSVAEAIGTANVIVTCTNSSTPLWQHAEGDIDGTLLPLSSTRSCIITGIGSYTPDMQEVPTATVNQCTQIWIDTPEAVAVGDLRHLSEQTASTGTAGGTVPVQPQLLGRVLLQSEAAGSVDSPGKTTSQTTSPTQYSSTAKHSLGLCFYKAVGTAIQDVMTAALVVERARELGLGTDVDMS